MTFREISRNFGLTMRGSASWFQVLRLFGDLPDRLKMLVENGGVYGTRTRGLPRDRRTL